jgi:raw score 9.06
MLRLFFLVFIGFSATHIVQAEPDFQIPQIRPSMQQHYFFHQQDMPFENKIYRLFIAEAKTKTAQKPSVLYLLDGNAQFPLAVNAADPNKPLPLIIGIGYVSDKAYVLEERTRDYTFPAQGEAFRQGGQAAGFLRFLQTKLKPDIARHYAPNEARQFFFGHSFGGLFGIYVLFHQPDLFQDYTLASPSLWWGNGEFLAREKPWLAAKPDFVSVTLGEFELYPQRDPDIRPEQQDKIRQRQKMAPMNAQDFANTLAEQGVKTQFKLIEGKNHGTSIEEAIRLTMERIQNR